MSLRRRRGYTLLEVTVSMFSASILVAGLGASLSLATRSASVSASSSATAKATAAAAEILNDLQTIKAFTVMGDETFTATVPDRQGGGGDDAMVYEWSKQSGDPLTRRINGGSRAVIVPAVAYMKFEYKTTDGAVWATRVILQPTASNASRIELLVPTLNRPSP